MEVYTPIPESAVRHAPRGIRVAGAVVLIAAFAFIALGVGRFIYTGPDDSIHHFGAVYTPLGLAEAECGGDSSTNCGDGTTLRFVECTDAVQTYFSGYYGTEQDARVRRLIGMRPPKGGRWETFCGWSKGWPAPSRQPAHLEPNV